MGTYYQYVNYTKREVIDLSGVANIKWGAYAGWSIQSAVLNTFLGFGWPRQGYGDLLKDWVGCWAKDSVCIEADCDEHESDDWPNKRDRGLEFLVYLRNRGKLAEWLLYAGIHGSAIEHCITQMKEQDG